MGQGEGGALRLFLALAPVQALKLVVARKLSREAILELLNRITATKQRNEVSQQVQENRVNAMGRWANDPIRKLPLNLAALRYGQSGKFGRCDPALDQVAVNRRAAV